MIPIRASPISSIPRPIHLSHTFALGMGTTEFRKCVRVVVMGVSVWRKEELEEESDHGQRRRADPAVASRTSSYDLAESEA